MRERDLPMMPFWVRDHYMATRRLATVERAAYIDLLCCEWTDGPLPDDMEQLAQMCALPVEEFTRAWKRLKGFFEKTADGLVFKRLEEQYVNAVRTMESRSRGARSANAQRYGQRPLSDTLSAHSTSSERHAQRPVNGRSSSSSSEEKNPLTPTSGGTGFPSSGPEKPMRQSSRANGTNPRAVEGARAVSAQRQAELDAGAKLREQLGVADFRGPTDLEGPFVYETAVRSEARRRGLVPSGEPRFEAGDPVDVAKAVARLRAEAPAPEPAAKRAVPDPQLQREARLRKGLEAGLNLSIDQLVGMFKLDAATVKAIQAEVASGKTAAQ